MEDLLFFVIMTAVFQIPLWVIFQKAGFNPAISLINIIPIIGSITVVLILAFRRWPNGEY